MKTTKFHLFLMVTFPYFSLFSQNSIERYDILINEFMANPKGANGLPIAEYVELYNASSKTINLKGWTIVNGRYKDTLLEYNLKPDSFILIHEFHDFSSHGTTMKIKGLSTLTNAGDEFILKDNKEKIIDAVKYDVSTYQNVTKAKGGWSLERINPKNPCLLDNWIANNGTGGTPCKRNSVYNPNFNKPTEVLNFYPENARTISIFLNKSLSESDLNVSHFSINNTLNFIGKPIINEPFFNSFKLTFDKDLNALLSYNLTLKNTLKSCKSIPLLEKDTIIQVKKPVPISEDSLVINEILLNPETGNFRFIELFNASKTQAYDLEDIKIVDNIKIDSIDISSHHIIFPHTYAVITENPNIVAKRYGVDTLKRYFLKHKLMTWDENKGEIVIKTSTKTIDKLTYNKTFHSPLLANTEGVSLERINPFNAKNDKSNWQSAAKTVSYGTPAYRNSQFNVSDTPSVSSTKNVDFYLENTAFSPDDDGFQDFLPIKYKVDKSGYVVNINIFDAQGRLVTNLEKNTSIALEGTLKWEGQIKRRSEKEENVKAPLGMYIVFIELLSAEGDRYTWKHLTYLSSR